MAENQMLKDMYIYEANFIGLAFGATATVNMQIQADSNFRWEKATFQCFSAAAITNITHATRISPAATILITDTGSGRQMMSGAVPIPNLFGTGEIPFILQQPKIFTARATIAVTVTNFDTALNYNLYLSFIGTKLFSV
jgi:hypothetical protein